MTGVVLGVVFDADHDFEGARYPKAHLDTVKHKPTASSAPPVVQGSATARRRPKRTQKKQNRPATRRAADLAIVYSGRRFASFQRQRAPAVILETMCVPREHTPPPVRPGFIHTAHTALLTF